MHETYNILKQHKKGEKYPISTHLQYWDMKSWKKSYKFIKIPGCDIWTFGNGMKS